MTAAYIAEALRGRRSGEGWVVHCPAHKDRTPSLSVRDAGGKVLIHCFGGCTQADVIAALRERGLWPEIARTQWTPAEKRAYGRRRRRAEFRAQDGLRWYAALIRELQKAKEAAYLEYCASPDNDSERRWAAAARDLYALENLSGAELVRHYKTAVGRDSAAVKRLIGAGKEDEAHARACTEVAIALLAAAGGVR